MMRAERSGGLEYPEDNNVPRLLEPFVVSICEDPTTGAVNHLAHTFNYVAGSTAAMAPSTCGGWRET